MLEIQVESKGFSASYDITECVADVLPNLDSPDGIAKIYAAGSTVGLVAMRYEPGAVEDLLASLQRIASSEQEYAHYRTTGDPNGYAHVWSSIVGSSLLIPYRNCKLAVSSKHRIVLFDFDPQPSSRTIYVAN